MMERDRITGFYFIWGSVEVIGLSQHHTIFTPLLRSECGPHQATCYDFYPPWPKSYELVPGQCTGRAGGNYGEQRRAATLHRANINNTVYTSSANKVCSLSLGCSMLQYWIWISWPSTTHIGYWTVFLRIFSIGPTFSCENSWVLFAMPWDMTITRESNNLESGNV